VDGLWATKSEGVGLISASFRDFQPMWSWSTNVTDSNSLSRDTLQCAAHYQQHDRTTSKLWYCEVQNTHRLIQTINSQKQGEHSLPSAMTSAAWTIRYQSKVNPLKAKETKKERRNTANCSERQARSVINRQYTGMVWCGAADCVWSSRQNNVTHCHILSSFSTSELLFILPLMAQWCSAKVSH